MNKEQRLQLAEAIKADAEGGEFEVGCCPVGRAFQWTSNLDGIGYYLDNLARTESPLDGGFYLRAKKEPVSRQWSKMSDVPPVCWIEFIDGSENLVLSVSPFGVKHVWMTVQNECVVIFRPWEELKTYSTDRETWLPCIVEERP